MSTINFTASGTNTSTYLENQTQWVTENNIDINDYVKIMLKPATVLPTWENNNIKWEKAMDSFIGKIARIIDISSIGIYLDLELPNSKCYIFPYFCLEKYDTRILKESQPVLLSEELYKYTNYKNDFCMKKGLIGKIMKITNEGYLIEYSDGTILFVDAIYKKYLLYIDAFFENQLVLVKNSNKNSIWIPGIFSHSDFKSSYPYYIKQSQDENSEGYEFCIPFKGNERLCGTSKNI